MKRLSIEIIIALMAATCAPSAVYAGPPEHRHGGGDSYSEHQHQPYYFRRYYYAPPDRGHARGHFPGH